MSTSPQTNLRQSESTSVPRYVTEKGCIMHMMQGKVIAYAVACMHVELFCCLAHDAGKGYAAPALPTEEEKGKRTVTGASKRKAGNLQGHFLPAPMRAKDRRLLAKAVCENCAGVALSFVETPAMWACTEVTGASFCRATLDSCRAG